MSQFNKKEPARTKWYVPSLLDNVKVYQENAATKLKEKETELMSV